MEFKEYATCFFLSIIITFFFSFAFRRKNKIPGPIGIPLLGPLHKIRTTAIHKTFESWSKYYGPLISIRLLGKKIIIVSGAEEIRTVLSGKSLDFSARPEMFRFSFLTDGHTGIAMGKVTEDWLKKKKSVAKALKIDKYEAVTKTIVKRLCELGEDESHYWDLNKDICIGLINIMTSLVLGKTFDFHSKDLLAYKSAMERSAEASFRLEGVVLDAIPQLIHVNFPRQICKTMKECRNTVSTFLIKEINNVISTYKEGTCRGLVDSLYEEYLKGYYAIIYIISFLCFFFLIHQKFNQQGNKMIKKKKINK